MEIEIQVGELSPEQKLWRFQYEEAVRFLRSHGYDAELVGLCVFSPTDNPAHIILRKP
jgi:hypothetical protein